MTLSSLVPTSLKNNIQLLGWGAGLTNKPEIATEAKVLIKTAIRTAIAAIAFFAALAFPKFALIVFVATCLVSLPSAAAAGLAYKANKCIPSLAAHILTNNLFGTFLGLSLLALSIYCINAFLVATEGDSNLSGGGLFESQMDDYSTQAANAFYPVHRAEAAAPILAAAAPILAAAAPILAAAAPILAATAPMLPDAAFPRFADGDDNVAASPLLGRAAALPLFADAAALPLFADADAGAGVPLLPNGAAAALHAQLLPAANGGLAHALAAVARVHGYPLSSSSYRSAPCLGRC